MFCARMSEARERCGRANGRADCLAFAMEDPDAALEDLLHIIAVVERDCVCMLELAVYADGLVEIAAVGCDRAWAVHAEQDVDAVAHLELGLRASIGSGLICQSFSGI